MAPVDSTRLVASLLEGMRAGRRAALARAISVVEDERTGFQELLHALLAGPVRRAEGVRIGVTGPPGAGKSSLVAGLARLARTKDEEVGVVAVDPTSPFTGGALLGDRIRMNELATDPGIFIRSMASRGSLGGLATTTKEIVDVMVAFGFARVFVETVGVGQTELEIAGTADTVIVVLVPESGDHVQAMKAGLMEIADIFVVNKADRPGADALVREIRTALGLRRRHGGATSAAGSRGSRGHHGAAAAAVMPAEDASRSTPGEASEERWTPPVLQARAHEGDGLDELSDAIERHAGWLRASGEIEVRRRRRAADRIRDVLVRELVRRAHGEVAREELLAPALGRIASGDSTAYTEAARILERLGVDPSTGALPADEPA